jgi:hypothetical protein
MPNWLVILTAVIQLLQTTGLLDYLKQLIAELIALLGGGTATQADFALFVMKLYAKIPEDKRGPMDDLLRKLIK